MKLLVALLLACVACDDSAPPRAAAPRGIEREQSRAKTKAPDDPFRRPEPPRRGRPLDLNQPIPAPVAEAPGEAAPAEAAPGAPAAEEAPPLDVNAALTTALSGSAGCVPASQSGNEVSVSVAAVVSATGRITRAEVSAPTPEIAECVRRRALSVHLSGPIPGAPVAASASLTFRR